MIKIILNGYLGKMGRVITNLAANDPDIEIVAGVDAVHSNKTALFPTFTHISDCDMPADVIIDFSIADAVPSIVEYAGKKRVPAVICTTGLSPEIEKQIILTSEKTAIFKSANMSLGVNLINNLLKRVSNILYDECFDIEIIERHHNQKIDAPSGTALLLADTINETLGGNMEYVYDRHDKREQRSKNQLGLHALRGGSIVGSHSVVFAGKDEVIELNHEAFSKDVFAVGALKAAKYIKGKAPGLYSMQNIMDEL